MVGCCGAQRAQTCSLMGSGRWQGVASSAPRGAAAGSGLCWVGVLSGLASGLAKGAAAAGSRSSPFGVTRALTHACVSASACCLIN